MTKYRKNGRFNEHSKETLLFIVLVDVVVVVVVWLNLKQLLLKAQKLMSILNCKVRKMQFLKWLRLFKGGNHF